MAEAAHTPGPWEIGFRKNGSAWFSMGDATSGPHKQFNIGLEAGEDEADARLIAAAPDLLEALKAAVEQLEKMGADGLASGAYAAISKAETAQ